MKIEKNELPKSQVELIIELSCEEFEPFIKRGAEKVANEVKIEGFRPGKVPYDILKQKIGEMTILEAAAEIAIFKNIEKIISENVTGEPVGQPQIELTKLAPNNPMEFKVKLAVIPEIKLGDYKDAKVKERPVEIKEEAVKKTIDDLREFKSQEILTDREIRDGDKTIVDINMYLDNIPIEGGQGKDTAVIVGKNYIIPGFDKHLTGARKGDTREFSLPYPEDYHMKNIAGKLVDFKVIIKEVYERQLPPADDQFAAGFGMKSFSEMEENIKKSLASQAKKENEQVAEREMIEKILTKSRFGDIPEMLIEHEAKTMLSEIEHSVTHEGGKFDDYLTSIGKTRDQLTLDILPDALKRVKISLMIREIAKAENIKVEKDDIEKHLEEMRKHYKDKSDIIDKVNSDEYKGYVVNVLSSRKVIDKLKEWNVDR